MQSGMPALFLPFPWPLFLPLLLPFAGALCSCLSYPMEEKGRFRDSSAMGMLRKRSLTIGSSHAALRASGNVDPFRANDMALLRTACS